MVYFIGPKRGMVKIGWTQQDIAVRLAALQNGNPERLHIMATVPAPRSVEKAYHARFSCLRHTGEWFLRAHPIMDEIRRLNKIAGQVPTRGGKLCEQQVKEILANNEGISQAKLARRYGVSRTSINRILNGHVWVDLTA